MPLFRSFGASEVGWFPEIDVFETENRLVTKIDLPGMKREDVKVEVTDGQLVISGERKSEAEEKKDRFYPVGARVRQLLSGRAAAARREARRRQGDLRERRARGQRPFAAPKPEAKPRKVEIQDGAAAAKTAA